MFFEYLFSDNLAQLLIKYFPMSDKWYVLISVFEYLFRVIFIGMILPIILFTNHKKFSFTKFFSLVLLLLTSFNILDYSFFIKFGFYPYQAIFIMWGLGAYLSYIIIPKLWENNLEEDSDEEMEDDFQKDSDEEMEDDIQEYSDEEMEDDIQEYSDEELEDDITVDKEYSDEELEDIPGENLNNNPACWYNKIN